MRCRSGDGCPRQAEEGKRFCATHGEVLDRVRAELELENVRRRKRGRRVVRKKPPPPGS